AGGSTGSNDSRTEHPPQWTDGRGAADRPDHGSNGITAGRAAPRGAPARHLVHRPAYPLDTDVTNMVGRDKGTHRTTTGVVGRNWYALYQPDRSDWEVDRVSELGQLVADRTAARGQQGLDRVPGVTLVAEPQRGVMADLLQRHRCLGVQPLVHLRVSDVEQV